MHLSATLRLQYLGENDSSSLCSALHTSLLTVWNLPKVYERENSVKNKDADFKKHFRLEVSIGNIDYKGKREKCIGGM